VAADLISYNPASVWAQEVEESESVSLSSSSSSSSSPLSPGGGVTGIKRVLEEHG